jgi:hypothetical protein
MVESIPAPPSIPTGSSVGGWYARQRVNLLESSIGLGQVHVAEEKGKAKGVTYSDIDMEELIPSFPCRGFVLI